MAGPVGITFNSKTGLFDVENVIQSPSCCSGSKPVTSAFGTVPVEMLDWGVSGDPGGPITFERTRFKFYSTDWAPGTTFSLEVVFDNKDSVDHTVTILNNAGGTAFSFILPHGTSSPTRMNVGAWTPSTDIYRFHMDTGPGFPNNQNLYTARLLAIVPQNPVMIDIDLLARTGASSIDQTAGDGDIFRTNSDTFTSTPSGGGQGTFQFQYNASDWSTLSMWRLTCTMSNFAGDGFEEDICLWDVTANVMVTGSMIAGLNGTPAYFDTLILPSALTDGHVYEPRMRRVGLYFGNPFNVYLEKCHIQALMTAWTKSPIYARYCKNIGGVNAQDRVIMQAATAFSKLNHIYVDSQGSGGQTSQTLADCGTSDSSSPGTGVAASSIIFPTPWGIVRSGDVLASVVIGDRYIEKAPLSGAYGSAHLLYMVST